MHVPALGPRAEYGCHGVLLVLRAAGPGPKLRPGARAGYMPGEWMMKLEKPARADRGDNVRLTENADAG